MTAVALGLRLPPRQAAFGLRGGTTEGSVFWRFLRFSGVDRIGGPPRHRTASCLVVLWPSPGEPRPPASHVRPVALPSNLEVAPVFQPFLDRMWQSSPTFRGQCQQTCGRNRSACECARRGSAASRAVLQRPHRSEASGTARWCPHRSISNRLWTPRSSSRMNSSTSSSSSMAWTCKRRPATASSGRAGDGAFETRRAIEAGRRVAQEITMGPTLTDGRDLPHRNPCRSSDDGGAAGSRRDAFVGAFSPRERQRALRRLHFPGATRRGRP